jgi:hypothetical protein
MSDIADKIIFSIQPAVAAFSYCGTTTQMKVLSCQ